ncbi:uncharacterized protein N7529_009763 [Penicillium soppii]|uniref:uncharacterized protein n=1 Tax=Penicillium soppii TaxID=69789 RepID=UPI00254705FC|nr:uncharacterized protein N7529_009763 [Penicillium soppii]KAJ5855819.1 hypothetical protein N7529_009763 [Penicillium soppii]
MFLRGGEFSTLFSTLLKEKHASFCTNMQKFISDLKSDTVRELIFPQTGVLFLQLSELRRIGELMGTTEPFNESLKNAPPQYFTARAQRHQSFYGTEYGYACWYIQASLGCTMTYLVDADAFESMMADFEIDNLNIFPRLLPLESAASTPSLSGSPTPLYPSTSVPLISAEITKAMQAPESSIGSDIAKLSQASRPAITDSLGGIPSLLQYSIPDQSDRRSRNPRVRVTSPNGRTTSPKRNRTRRRATPYPERGDLYKGHLRKHSSAGTPLSPIPPPPSPYRCTEGQNLKPPATSTDIQAREQPFYTP